MEEENFEQGFRVVERLKESIDVIVDIVEYGSSLAVLKTFRNPRTGELLYNSEATAIKKGAGAKFLPQIYDQKPCDFDNKQSGWILMEYLGPENYIYLLDEISQQPNRPKEKLQVEVVRYLVNGVLNTIEEIHQKKILLTDLKLDHFFAPVSERSVDNPMFKYIDYVVFSASRSKQDPGKIVLKTNFTPSYLHPNALGQYGNYSMNPYQKVTFTEAEWKLVNVYQSLLIICELIAGASIANSVYFYLKDQLDKDRLSQGEFRKAVLAFIAQEDFSEILIEKILKPLLLERAPEDFTDTLLGAINHLLKPNVILDPTNLPDEYSDIGKLKETLLNNLN